VEELPTLPLGGLVNHRVHLFMRGCLTLKFSGSSNTVRMVLSSVAAVEDFSLELLWSDGEIGIVSSGTCWEGFGADATSAMVVDCDQEAGWAGWTEWMLVQVE
jgi:hypothetical protein